MEELHKIQVELKEQKENVSKLKRDSEEIRKYITKKNDDFIKIQSLYESLIKKVKNLKQEKSRKEKWEKDDSREYLKKKEEDICRLRNHNKKLLYWVKILKEERKSYQNQEEMMIFDEESTKRLEEEICKKVEESLNADEVKLEIQSKLEEGRHNLINGVMLQFQKEKEYKIQEGRHKIVEEVELHPEDVHAKYDGIISKSRVIKYQENMIEDAIVFEKKTDERSTQSEDKTSNVKPYRHPHYHEIFQGIQEGRYQHYQGRIWNTCQYSWNKASQNHYSIRYYHMTTYTTN
jgi:hypothetical protein